MTKKILVALAMFPMAAFASGITPGTVELKGGTNLGFVSGSSKSDPGGDKTDVTQYGLDATGLYYVNPNLSIGAQVQYDSTKFEFPGGGERGSKTLRIGPAIAYEQEVAPQVAVFGLGTVGYVRDTTTATGTPDDTGSGFGFGLEAGAKYFIVKSVSLNAALSYDYAKLSFDEVGGVTPKRTDSAFGVLFGVSVYLGGK
jgi:long-subunit fatty acid transport protein